MLTEQIAPSAPLCGVPGVDLQAETETANEATVKHTEKTSHVFADTQRNDRRRGTAHLYRLHGFSSIDQLCDDHEDIATFKECLARGTTSGRESDGITCHNGDITDGKFGGLGSDGDIDSRRSH